jgi:hypothetical protein
MSNRREVWIFDNVGLGYCTPEQIAQFPIASVIFYVMLQETSQTLVLKPYPSSFYHIRLVFLSLIYISSIRQLFYTHIASFVTKSSWISPEHTSKAGFRVMSQIQQQSFCFCLTVSPDSCLCHYGF